MGIIETVRITIALLFNALLLLFIIKKIFHYKFNFSTKIMTKTAIFTAISVILYSVPFFKFSLPIFPAFLEIHLDEVPLFICSFAYGPISGTIGLIVKTLIKLPLTTTMGVGELADLLYSLAFIIPAAVIYRRKRNIKGAIMGLLIGGFIQLVVSSFFTSFVMLYFYMNVMGLSKEVILSMCQAVNPMVTDLGFTFLLFVALPFNAIKDVIVIVLTLVLYKKIHTFVDKVA